MKQFVLACVQVLFLFVTVGYAQADHTDFANTHNVSMQKASLQHVVVSQQVGKAQVAKPIFVKSDSPVVKITLSANPTTGYSWFLIKVNDHLVQPVSAVFAPPANKKLMGAPGTVTWTFKLTKAAFKVRYVTTVGLIYARPWDLSIAEHKVITLVT